MCNFVISETSNNVLHILKLWRSYDLRIPPHAPDEIGNRFIVALVVL